jgi:ferredoxin
MGWQHIVGWIIEGMIVFVGMAFFVTSVLEREKRAAALSLTLTVVKAAVWAGIMLLAGAYLPYIVGAVVVLGAAALFAVSIPLGKSEPLRPTGKQEKVDERDIIFTRGKLLKMYPEHYEEYYKRHPEYKDVDDKIRKLPDIGEPGGRFYERVNTEMTNAMFDWLEDLRPFVDGEVAAEKVEMPPEAAAMRIKGCAGFLGAKITGITRLNQAYVYSHVGRGLGGFGEEINLDHKYAIAFAVEMRRPFVKQAPGVTTMLETCKGYVECAKIGQLLARYIRTLGYPARAHIDANYRVMCVPIAVDAGLGELSRMGYLITRKYGPRVRLGVVTTDLPMTTDSPVEFGVRDFCSKCKKCALNCPSKAIPFDDEPQDDVKGVRKWELDREACYRFWRQSGTDCAICMSVCTFSKPDSFLHRIIRFLIKRNALARRIAVAGDDIMYGKRPRSAVLPEWMKTTVESKR